MQIKNIVDKDEKSGRVQMNEVGRGRHPRTIIQTHKQNIIIGTGQMDRKKKQSPNYTRVIQKG